ncbi:hypothetical protein TWF730_001832 [Orbilia blumenaviensis]|uniref:Uncharacterized protein n=1 Tax=Orbilia blumenaviensis TaxID=1796055 RepID=A0AAV9UCW5_9PEZI
MAQELERLLADDTKPYGAAGSLSVIPKFLSVLVRLSSEFLEDAESHLQLLTDEILSNTPEKPTVEFQMNVTKTIHKLLTLWAEVRRRTTVVLNLMKRLLSSRFVKTNFSHPDNRIDGFLEGSFQELQLELQDHLGKIDILVEKTKALNSLVFNLANLYNSHAAIEEAKAANTAATSVHRITSLSFVYLPITLAATIYGVNLSPNTGDEGQNGIWVFIVVSIGLLLVTLPVLCVWIWNSWTIEWCMNLAKREKTVANRDQVKKHAVRESEL